MAESTLLVIGAILGIAASIIGSILIYRNATKTHSEFVAKVLLEEAEIQSEISQLSPQELALTEAGRELLVISSEIQDGHELIYDSGTEQEFWVAASQSTTQFGNSVNATYYEEDILDKTQILAERKNDWKTINPKLVVIPDPRDILRARDFNFVGKEKFSLPRKFDYINPELSLEQ